MLESIEIFANESKLIQLLIFIYTYPCISCHNLCFMLAITNKFPLNIHLPNFLRSWLRSLNSSPDYSHLPSFSSESIRFKYECSSCLQWGSTDCLRPNHPSQVRESHEREDHQTCHHAALSYPDKACQSLMPRSCDTCDRRAT